MSRASRRPRRAPAAGRATARRPRRPGAGKGAPGYTRGKRHAPDLDEVVDVTVDLLARHGESGLRIEDVMERTGISKSSLYANFGDRDGLIAAALSKVYAAYVDESIAGIRAILDRSHTPAELREALRGATTFTQDLTRTAIRVDRLGVIAGTRGRPAHARALTAVQTKLNDELAIIIQAAQDRRLISPRHSPRLIATYLQAYTLGRVLAAFDAGRASDEQSQWNALIDDVIGHLLFE